jgi:hypothetical protein
MSELSHIQCDAPEGIVQTFPRKSSGSAKFLHSSRFVLHAPASMPGWGGPWPFDTNVPFDQTVELIGPSGYRLV